MSLTGIPENSYLAALFTPKNKWARTIDPYKNLQRPQRFFCVGFHGVSPEISAPRRSEDCSLGVDILHKQITSEKSWVGKRLPVSFLGNPWPLKQGICKFLSRLVICPANDCLEKFLFFFVPWEIPMAAEACWNLSKWQVRV